MESGTSPPSPPAPATPALEHTHHSSPDDETRRHESRREQTRADEEIRRHDGLRPHAPGGAFHAALCDVDAPLPVLRCWGTPFLLAGVWLGRSVGDADRRGLGGRVWVGFWGWVGLVGRSAVGGWVGMRCRV